MHLNWKTWPGISPLTENSSNSNWGLSPGILVLTHKHLAFKLETIARNFAYDQRTPPIKIAKRRQEFCFWKTHAPHLNWRTPPGNFGSGRQTPRNQTGKRRQEVWIWPPNTSHLNWEIPTGILVLTEKRLAFKLVNTSSNFGSNQKTPRVQSGKYCQEFWFRPKKHAAPKFRFWPTNTSHLNWEISPGVLVLAEKRIASKLVNTDRNFGSPRKTPRMRNW